jgi:ferritin
MALISDEMIKMLNYRIEQEEASSRLYLAMSLWLDVNGYTGAAKKWKQYSDEEKAHAEWSYKYLTDLNIIPTIPALETPKNDFKGGLPQIIVESYKHEIEITKQVTQFAKAANEAGDYMTFGIAQKFVAEQIEELAKTNTLVDKLKAFGTDKIALRLLDNELGE